MPPARRPLIDRLWALVDRTDDCWEWQGFRDHGYGKISEGGRGSRTLLAHRVAYEAVIGPIPSGMQVDHLCRNRGCVNPTHMEVVTHRENMRRSIGPMGTNARKTHCSNGHSYDATNTHVKRDGSRLCIECSRLRQSRHPVRQRSYVKRYGKADNVLTTAALNAYPTAES